VRRGITTPTTVLVAGRRSTTWATLATALGREGFDVRGPCRDAASAVAEAARSHPDVCLVEIDLPGGGLTTVRALLMQRSATRVVVLTPTRRPDDVYAAKQAGAAGCAVEHADPRELAGELAAVLDADAAEFRVPTDPRRSTP